MKKNFWSCVSDDVAVWEANLSALWSRPKDMLEWACALTIAAEELEVMRVIESDTLGYRRERDGSIIPFIELQYSETQTVDLFYFTSPSVPVNGYLPRPRISGKLAYFGELDEIQEEDVEQVGKLMLRCRPEIEEPAGAIETGGVVISPCPPLRGAGPQICFSGKKKSMGMFQSSSVRIRFMTNTDIWQPWVHGRVEPVNWDNRQYDNFALAERHTPRLNKFLGLARARTIELGGTWRYANDYSQFDYTHLYCEDGVRMDEKAKPAKTPRHK